MVVSASQRSTATRTAPTEQAMAEAWERQWFRVSTLDTLSGRRVRVLYPGRRSGGGGPDFQGALVEIDGVLHRGDVELHLRPSLWRQHGHHRDPAYGQVILHVVFEVDSGPVEGLRGAETLCIAPFLKGHLEELAGEASATSRPVCCHIARRIEDLEPVVRALARRRFERKTSVFEANAAAVGRDQALWEGCLAVLGYPWNRAGFEVLARTLPWGWVAAELAYPERLEALVMGVAGWLEQASPAARREWPSIAGFWDVSPLPAKVWRSWGFRPTAPPWRRLLGLVRLLARRQGWHLLSEVGRIVSRADVRAGSGLVRLLTSGPAPQLGSGCAVELLANVLLPAVAAEGFDREAWLVWCQLPSNGYGITRRMESSFGIEGGPRRVFWTQGLLELRTRYCAEARQHLCPLGEGGW